MCVEIKLKPLPSIPILPPTHPHTLTPSHLHTLTSERVLEGFRQHGLGGAEVFRGGAAGVESAVQTHLLQHVHIVVQLKGTVKVEHVL